MTGSPAAPDQSGSSTPPETTPQPGSGTQRGSDPYADYANPPPRVEPAPPPAPRTPPPAAPEAQAGSGAGGPPNGSRSPSDFIARLFGRRGVRTEDGDGEGQPGREPASRPDQTAPGAAPAPPSPAAQPGPRPELTGRAGEVAQYLAGLSAAEIDALAQADGPFSRAVQSEIDRRVARANKERDQQGRFVRQQRVQELKQQARQLRQTDVYKAAELEEQVDGLEQQEAFVRGLVEHYDRVSIDPIVQALPEADRAPLLAAVPDGLEGRAQLVRAALARLEQVWRADEARRLRNGNGRGRRENADRRAQYAEDAGEPELVPGIGRGRNGTPTMNDWLRQQMNK